MNSRDQGFTSDPPKRNRGGGGESELKLSAAWKKERPVQTARHIKKGKVGRKTAVRSRGAQHLRPKTGGSG